MNCTYGFGEMNSSGSEEQHVGLYANIEALKWWLQKPVDDITEAVCISLCTVCARVLHWLKKLLQKWY